MTMSSSLNEKGPIPTNLTKNLSYIIPASLKSRRTFNPIRNIVDNLQPDKNHPLPLLNLALGDPTAYGNLQCPSVLIDAVQDLLDSGIGNGYLPSTGSVTARTAIAQYSSRDGYPTVGEDDVIIASGCSGAVELAISVLLNEGDNILVPRPGFPLYEVITNSLGAKVKHYNLLESQNWECDLEHMESLIDTKTKAILINNPSNPCGSNFLKTHLERIASIASKHNLPIIADEIYGGCVYDGEFIPMFTVAHEVPILSLGGLAKQYVVPGWRVGWVVIHDTNSHNRFSEIRAGLKSLSQLILGANSLIQTALPRVLTPIPDSKDYHSLQAFHKRYMSILKSNALLCEELASSCSELKVVVPQGAMYAMIGIKLDMLEGIVDDSDFAKQLLKEENLVLLPGQCFGMSGYVRIVTCPPKEVIREAFDSLKHFISKHRKHSDNHQNRHHHQNSHNNDMIPMQVEMMEKSSDIHTNTTVVVATTAAATATAAAETNSTEERKNKISMTQDTDESNQKRPRYENNRHYSGIANDI